MEGIAAIAIVFILFSVLAQAATALIAHRAAQSAVTAAAYRAALDSTGLSADVARLTDELMAIVPGARDVFATIETRGRVVEVVAEFRFVPPGPAFRTIRMEVSADAPLVVEP